MTPHHRDTIKVNLVISGISALIISIVGLSNRDDQLVRMGFTMLITGLWMVALGIWPKHIEATPSAAPSLDLDAINDRMIAFEQAKMDECKAQIDIMMATRYARRAPELVNIDPEAVTKWVKGKTREELMRGYEQWKLDLMSSYETIKGKPHPDR